MSPLKEGRKGEEEKGRKKKKRKKWKRKGREREKANDKIFAVFSEPFPANWFAFI